MKELDNILIIEDTGIQRIRIEKILQSYGFINIETVSSKKLQVINVAKYIEGRTMIIIDHENHYLNFDWLMKKIRQEKTSIQLPIIILSSIAKAKTVKQAYALGGNDFIIKPYSDLMLMERVLKYTSEPTMEDTKVIEQTSNNEDEIAMTSSKRDGESTSDKPGLVLKWHQDFEIGVEDIDKEHESLIRQYDQLYQSMVSGKGQAYFEDVLEFLKSYVNEHFSHEEALQKQIKYPRYEIHHQIHEHFKKQLDDIVRTHKEGQVSSQELIRFCLFVKNWLIYHILIEDKNIGAFLKESSEN